MISPIWAKEQLLQIIGTAFVGWLISDGYGAYRWYEKRQRCLAHLIRKALALTQAVDAEAKQIGQWLLEELRELIHQIATAGSDHPDDPGTARLQSVAQLVFPRSFRFGGKGWMLHLFLFHHCRPINHYISFPTEGENE
jgi:Transposase IS66 family